MTLAEQLSRLRAHMGSTQPSGAVQTGVPGVLLFWDDAPIPRSPLLYEPGLVVMGQGRKVGYLGDRRFEYDAGSCPVLGVPVPFECEVQVSPGEPALGIRLDVDVPRLAALVERLGVPEPSDDAAHHGVEAVPMVGPLYNATQRLLASLSDPLDREVVAPAAVDEMLYRILRQPQGRVLASLTRQHSSYAQISRALMRMHADCADAMSMEELAHASAMSVSSFHRAFKQVTGETPLQYLKKLRLLKAKALLVYEGLRVEETAYAVGYASPSQFSREFKRYFRRPLEADQLPWTAAG